MARPTVKLQLDLKSFDEAPFIEALERCEAKGLRFETLQSLGDTAENRQRLYELNKTCSEDIPARGPFYSFEDYAKARFERISYDPEGIIIALDKKDWVGLSVSSNWSDKGFVFVEMTGVLPSHRRKGLGTAMKLLGIRFARDRDVDTIYTILDVENDPAIQLNRHMGFIDADWSKPTPE